MTYSRDAETPKSSSTMGQAPKMGSPDDISEDVDRQSMEKIPELLNCIIVRCTHVPVRIGQNWADCNMIPLHHRASRASLVVVVSEEIVQSAVNSYVGYKERHPASQAHNGCIRTTVPSLKSNRTKAWRGDQQLDQPGLVGSLGVAVVNPWIASATVASLSS